MKASWVRRVELIEWLMMVVGRALKRRLWREWVAENSSQASLTIALSLIVQGVGE